MVIADIAERQHGVVTRRQLIAAGLGEEAIRYRLVVRRLLKLYDGIYIVGHEPTRYGRYLAAVLACGDDAVASHRSAGAILGITRSASSRFDVTIERGGSRSKPDIDIHTTRSLHPDEIAPCEGIPCTTFARTLVDLAAVAEPRELRRTLERSLELNLFDRVALEATLARSRGRRGIAKLRRLLIHLSEEPPPVRSELERRFFELVRGAGLPMPVVNGRVAGLEVDFHWPDHLLIVETDGAAVHGHSLAFHSDRDRDLTLALTGWHVLRFTWRQIVDSPQHVTAVLRRRLAAQADVTRSGENR